MARDAENSYLELDPAAGGPLDDLIGHVTYRVAVGPRAGQKVFSLQTCRRERTSQGRVWRSTRGCPFHAGIGVEAAQREKLERLARYVTRPPVSVERLDLTAQGQVRYRLKTPYRDGTTYIVLEAHAWLRAASTPGGRGTWAQKRAAESERLTPEDIRMNWARRLKRVFGVEIEQCVRCGGRLKVIASIEEPELIERILAHRWERGEEAASTAALGGASAAADFAVLIPRIVVVLVHLGCEQRAASSERCCGAVRRARTSAACNGSNADGI